jgi:hypothetical protein
LFWIGPDGTSCAELTNRGWVPANVLHVKSQGSPVPNFHAASDSELFIRALRVNFDRGRPGEFEQALKSTPEDGLRRIRESDWMKRILAAFESTRPNDTPPQLNP